MNLGTQYYRAPFPQQEYWERDFRKIHESGLNTVQLWALWGWIEAKPGHFNFDDYDRLVELAGKHHLQVVLSCIAEIQPHWIFREVPGSEMIDRNGNKVISSLRCECNFGLTPGGCSDHPGVRAHMKQFLEALGKRYADCPQLHGWDLWNELRWNEQADELVCFCPHTLEAFRSWLKERFGSLDALNDVWHRRYIDWDDVMPGKRPDRPYSEMMAWENFITDRADRHGAWRYSIMRGVDPIHPITAHGACPSVNYSGNPQMYPLDRGNDWNLAASLDGIGCSSFPAWGNIDDAEFGSRVEMVHAAAAGKHIWLSEVQGGRAGVGFELSEDVRPEQQQRWLWNGLACGADTILFWCWRDEVFGREAGFFGLDGSDEFSPDRLKAMRETGDLLTRYTKLFDAYRPEEAQIGILFSPKTYYLGWAQEGNAKRMQDAIDGYARALVRHSISSTFVEAEHLEHLDKFRLLILPHTIVLDDLQAQKLTEFVQNGGSLLVESECGAFDSAGFYRYPEKRFLAPFGIAEAGRRKQPAPRLALKVDDAEFSLETEQWLTPLRPDGATPTRIFAQYKEFPLAAEFAVGKGKIFYLGSYFGNAYRQTPNADFERFLARIAQDSGVVPSFEPLSAETGEDAKFLYIKSGEAEGRRMLFCFFPDDTSRCRLKLHGLKFSGKFVELQTGELLVTRNDVLEIAPARRHLSILCEQPE